MLHRRTAHTVQSPWNDSEDAASIDTEAPAEVASELSSEIGIEVAPHMGLAGDEHIRHADWYMAVFDANVSHPAGSALAFHPPGGGEATAEEGVEWATSYRAIELCRRLGLDRVKRVHDRDAGVVARP